MRASFLRRYRLSNGLTADSLKRSSSVRTVAHHAVALLQTLLAAARQQISSEIAQRPAIHRVDRTYKPRQTRKPANSYGRHLTCACLDSRLHSVSRQTLRY